MSLTIAGLIVTLASQFIPADEVQTVMEAAGILVAWWGRYRIGDIFLFGTRK